MDKDSFLKEIAKHPAPQHETYYFADASPYSNGDTVKTLMRKKGRAEVAVAQLIFSCAKGDQTELKKQEILLIHLIEHFTVPIVEQALATMTGKVVGGPAWDAPAPKKSQGQFTVSDEYASARCLAHIIRQKEKSGGYKKFARFIYLQGELQPIFTEQIRSAVRDLEYTLPGIKALFSPPSGPKPTR